MHIFGNLLIINRKCERSKKEAKNESQKTHKEYTPNSLILLREKIMV